MKIRSRLLLPGLALAACLGFSVAASAQMVVGSAQPVQKFPGSPVKPGGGPGGQYHGPSDIVPPSLPAFDPNDPNTCPAQTKAVCNPSLLAGRCGSAPSCPALRLAEGTSQCVHCQNEPDDEDEICYAAQGWSLTFGMARTFCHAPDPSCLDARQNVTVCATHPASCEIHLLESDWINHDLSPNRPVCAPVAVQACLGNDALFDHPQAFESLDQATGECGPHTVCLTFNKDCLCNAILSWESSLGLGTAPSPSHDNQFLFHIGFTTCETCDCPGTPVIPVEP
jgi:hypothetical protein